MPSASKGPVTKKFAEWKTPPRIKALSQKLAHYERVKTIANPEKALRIRDFYFPPIFAYTNGRRFEASKLEDFGLEEHPLIEGIAGQGKSIFMRQLCVEELKRGERLPLLVELRRINSQNTLGVHIISQLTALGLPEPEYIWADLADSEKVVLLLDGFDEVKEDQRETLLNDVELLANSTKIANCDYQQAGISS